MGWLGGHRAGDVAGLAYHFANRLRWRHGGFKSPSKQVATYDAGRYAAPLNPFTLRLGLRRLDRRRRCGV